jgi:hypothetical protein
LVGHNINNLETLLEQHAILDLILDSELDLDSSRVRFCPDEMGVYDADFVQASKFLEAQSQQFSRFRSGDNPTGGGHEPSVAVSAEVEGRLSLDALGDVDGELDAVVAKSAGGSGSIDGSTTVTAQNTERFELAFAPKTTVRGVFGKRSRLTLQHPAAERQGL